LCARQAGAARRRWFAAAAAAFSRYFWPVRSAHAWRGEQLLEAFSMPVRGSRASRERMFGVPVWKQASKGSQEADSRCRFADTSGFTCCLCWQSCKDRCRCVPNSHIGAYSGTMVALGRAFCSGQASLTGTARWLSLLVWLTARRGRRQSHC
jgi:hypothetical protein